MPPFQSKKPRQIAVDLKGAGPHNGEGRPNLQFPDPITGEMIGGQVAAVRMCMRYPHVVLPWARRGGKTKFRQFLIPNEACITSGHFWAGMLFPDHTTAYKIADNFRSSWGGMVKDAKLDDKSQDRWIELHPFTPPREEPPAWFTPRLKARWTRCWKGDRNTSCKVYFWGGAHPHYGKIQGFPHPFHRIDVDESQEVDRRALSIVRPMLRDVMGHECFSGTPWAGGIGNAWFSKFWNLAGKPTSAGWFRMRIPDGANPHVPRTNLKEARLTLTEAEIRQSLYAEFLTDEGSVFSNLDRVFVLTPLPADDPATDWIRALRSRYAMPSMEWWVHAPAPEAGHVIALSVDWARSPKGDWTAVTVMDFTTGKQLALLRWRGENFVEQLEVVLAIAAHYGANQCHADANGMGESMSDFMRRRHAKGFVGHKFGRNKADYVRRAQILFREASISLIRCEAQEDEFRDFSAFESDSLSSERQITYAAPQGEHDDMVAALLHLAPTLTIVGRQDPPAPEPVAQPLLDEQGRTTLQLWAGEGVKLPWFREDGGKDISWDDVVLPGSLA